MQFSTRERPMISKVREFVIEQQQVLTERARKLGKAPGKVVRGVAARSAKRIKALQEPARVVTHSGVQLTNLSHEALLGLMALQLEIVTSALSDTAAQLERVAQSEDVSDLVRGQADELRATRERVVSDVNRAVAIVRDAGRGVRKVATETYTKVARPAKGARPAARSTRARKAKRPGRKPAVAKRATRKAKAKA
jgi:phasin family protein